MGEVILGFYSNFWTRNVQGLPWLAATLGTALLAALVALQACVACVVRVLFVVCDCVNDSMGRMKTGAGEILRSTLMIALSAVVWAQVLRVLSKRRD